MQVAAANELPTAVYLNGQNCTVVQVTAPAPPPSAGGAEDAGSLTTLNGQIIGVNGQPLYLIGPNYFGFDDGNTMLDGLWEGKASECWDYSKITFLSEMPLMWVIASPAEHKYKYVQIWMHNL